MKCQTLTILLSLLFLSAKIFAQPSIKAQVTTGGSDYDIFQNLCLTKDGGVLEGGYSYSSISGQKNENSRGSSDYWVVKLNKSGKIEWQRTIGGTGEEYLRVVEQTPDSGYILGGSSPSNTSGEKTENSRGWWDYWIVKLDKSGNIQWNKTIGGNNTDELTALKLTKDGGYILGGYSSSNISGEKTENTRGSTDYWIVKLNSYGNIEWDKTIGGSNEDDLSSVEQTNDGGYIIGGSSYSGKYADKTEENRNTQWYWTSDYWVVKLDSSGKIEWDKSAGGNTFDNLRCVRQTNDGGYLLGGESVSNISSEKTENSRGITDYWIVKLTRTGAVQWDKTIGGSQGDALKTIELTSDGSVILGGYSYSNISGEKTENSRGDADYWVVKLDRFRNILWDKTIGGAAEDFLFTVKEINTTTYVLGGYSSSGISGDKLQSSRGNNDYWSVVLNNQGSEITSASSSTKKDVTKQIPKLFTVFPNPAKNNITVSFNTSKQSVYNISVVNMEGKQVMEKRITAVNGENTITLDVSQFVKGIYLVKLSDNSGNVQIQKFVKQ